MTAQVSETLIYKGKEYPMFTNPLELYLKQNKSIRFQSPHTACWRGYVGTWEIKGPDDENLGLYLVDLIGYQSGEVRFGLKDVFPEQDKGVFAHWFSGEVRCPMGKQIEYVHMGYASKYEHDFLLEFNKGILVAKKTVSNNLDITEGE